MGIVSSKVQKLIVEPYLSKTEKRNNKNKKTEPTIKFILIEVNQDFELIIKQIEKKKKITFS